MITGELKSKIDSIWDIFWSSGMTNPLTVIEQITYLMFIKILDDNELRKEANAAVFDMPVVDPIFDEAHQNCRWSKFRHMEAEAMFRNMADQVFPFIKAGLHGGRDAMYSKYLQNALFLIPSPRILTKVVASLDSLDLSGRDVMGDVYETILDQMGQSGKNGQFRTPRHIAQMMIELVRPTLDDTVCDPAMGTAGFLCGTAQYLSEHYSVELMKAENKERFNTSMFTGFDADQTMLRIGAMNMLLHGVEQPAISWRDALSEENHCREQFSLILANPPFSGSMDQDAIAKDLHFAVNQKQMTAKTEVLFLALFLRMLKTGGRCACVVPGGILSASYMSPYRAMRKELVEHQRLEAVISMPNGIFHPYTGTSTGILIFTKTDQGGTDQVWFYNMKADGLSLTSTRKPIEQNDIPDIIQRFHHLEQEKGRSRSDQSFFVSRQEIADHDYHLGYERYYQADSGADGEAMARIHSLTAEIRELLEQSRLCDQILAEQLEVTTHEA